MRIRQELKKKVLTNTQVLSFFIFFLFAKYDDNNYPERRRAWACQKAIYASQGQKNNKAKHWTLDLPQVVLDVPALQRRNNPWHRPQPLDQSIHAGFPPARLILENMHGLKIML